MRLLSPSRKSARSQTALKHVKLAFKQGRQLPPEQQEKELEIARMYASYLIELKEYSDLIHAYNIGKSEKTTKQILEATAASTGLRLAEEPSSSLFP